MESCVQGLGGTGGEVKERVNGGSLSPAAPSDFSIEHILKSAGSKCKRNYPTPGGSADLSPVNVNDIGECVGEGDSVLTERQQQHQTRFEWLQCTRYHPPKLPRSRRKEAGSLEGKSSQIKSPQQQRRKLGRNPRIPFSSSQVSALEQRFRRGHYLSSADVAALSAGLRLSETRVKIWFQNRRARERRDREARAAKANEPSSIGNEETMAVTTRHLTSSPDTQTVPSAVDSTPKINLRPIMVPVVSGPQHPLFSFNSPLGMFNNAPNCHPNTFHSGMSSLQGLTSAFLPISPHPHISQTATLVGSSAVLRTHLSMENKIVTTSAV